MISVKQDLRFQPVRNPSPVWLTRGQIESFNTDGFVQPLDVFSTAEISEIRRYFDGLMHDLGPKGAYGINCYQARLSGLYDIATDTRILNFVRDLLGNDILCWASAILSKEPHDPKAVPWHQDAAYWALSPARTVTVWLAIDDADADNAAMRFIPGTHKLGELPVAAADQSTNVFHRATNEAEKLGEPFVNELRAGQISLHADMLVHGSLANMSDRRRCGLTLRYCPPEVDILNNDWAKGVEAILCNGDAGQWTTHSRPANNDIMRTSSPHVVGNN